MDELSLRLLVVDDDVVDRIALVRGLRSAGLSIDCEELDSVGAAIERITDETFDCVFLDFHLPDGTGLDILKRVRGDGVRTPMVILTGHGDEDLAVQLMKAGASDYLPKGTTTPERLAQSLRNVLRVHEAETRLREAEEAREAAMAARSRFYAAMSHELRTPINAILGYNDLLLASVYGDLNEKQLEGLQGAQRAARHLLELVNDVLDLSKLEAGKMELQTESVSIPGVVEDLFATILPLARDHGCELDFRDVGCGTVVTDPRRVRQILLNLLSNAVKYGAGKPVKVICRPAEADGVAVEVTDRGPGIAASDVTRVFEDFVQLDESGQTGTGLGLPISKRLAELLQGRLEVDSERGRGSTFRLVLPERLEEADRRPDPDPDRKAVASGG